MKLIFLYGPAASGKLTVAKALAARTGWKLFHNHLTIDLLLSVFEFGDPGFVRLREQIWLGVFDEAAKAGLPALIFTYAPERSVPAGFIDRAVAVVEAAGGEVVFVELTCPLEVIEARLVEPSRRAFGKLTDLAQFRRLRASGALDDSERPRVPYLVIDSASTGPEDAALAIARRLGAAPGASAGPL